MQPTHMLECVPARTPHTHTNTHKLACLLACSLSLPCACDGLLVCLLSSWLSISPPPRSLSFVSVCPSVCSDVPFVIRSDTDCFTVCENDLRNSSLSLLARAHARMLSVFIWARRILHTVCAMFCVRSKTEHTHLLGAGRAPILNFSPMAFLSVKHCTQTFWLISICQSRFLHQKSTKIE